MREDAQQVSSWLSFRLGASRHALPLGQVQEVVELAVLTRLPQAPPAVLGVLDLRGTPLVVLDLGLKLGAGATRTTRFSCVVVVEWAGGQVGLLVERVEGLIEVGAGEIVACAEPGILGEVTVSGMTLRLLDLGAALALGGPPAPGCAQGIDP